MESSLAAYPTGIARRLFSDMYAFTSRTAAFTKADASVLVSLFVTSFPAKKPRTLGY